MPDRDGAKAKTFETLHTLLTTARDLAQSLADDPQASRLLCAFRMLPEADREPILGVVEKAALWRRIVNETQDVTGISASVNPNASLYVHVLREVDDVVRRDTDVISRGIETFLRLLPLLFQDDVHALWTAAARAVDSSADETTRHLLQRLVDEVQAILREDPF